MGITAINYDLYFKRQKLYFVSGRHFNLYVCMYLFIYLLVGNLEVMCYFDQKKKY